MQQLPFRQASLIAALLTFTTCAQAEGPGNSLLDAIRASQQQAKPAEAPADKAGGKAPQPARPADFNPFNALKPTDPSAPVMPPPTLGGAVAAKPAAPAAPATPSSSAAATTAAPTATAGATPVPAAAAPADDATATPISTRKEIVVKQPKFGPGNGVTLRFDNADIYEVVQTVMGEILGLNYIVDPGVQGKININGLTPVSQEDVLGVLQSVLALNNVSIIREGNLYKVMRDSLVPRDSISGASVGENGAMVQIFATKFVQPSAMIGVLKNFIGPQAGIVNDPTNHYLIVSDRARNVKKIQELIESLDVDYLDRVQMEVVQIVNGDATELAKEMETLFKTSQLYNWPGTEPNKVFFMPIKRMNAIMVAASTKPVLEMAKRRIREVDALPIEGIGSRINMYSVKNSSAAYLSDLITQIYGGASSGASSSSSSTGLSSASSSTQQATKVVQKGPSSATTTTGAGLSGEVQIIPNEKANSLIIKANRQDYLQILGMLEKLDTVPRQVLIQANIIEVTLGGTKSLGLEWNLLHEQASYRGQTYKSSATSANTTGTLATVNAALAGSKAATPPAGLLYTLFDGPGNAIASIQAAANDSLLNVLSSPRIVASDGKEARIEIGDEVPVSTGTTVNPTTSGNVTTSSVTYRTVGLILKVKPSINESGLVNLQLSQEVSQVNPNSAADSTTPSFSTRKIETEVSIQEGKTLTIGGLLSDNQSTGDNGIPYFKDVPVLGSLFGSTSKSRTRRELLLTITPYVMRNQGDADRINQQLDEAMEEVRAFTTKIKPNALDLSKKNPQPQPRITVSVDK